MQRGQPRSPCMSDSAGERDRNLRGDAAFKRAMLRARDRERFVVGVDIRPCTDSPIFVPHLAPMMLRVSSIDDL